MSFQEHKLTDYAVSIAGLPDKIENKAQWLKQQFDARTDSEVRDKHNSLIDALDEDLAGRPTNESMASAIDEKVVELGAGDMAQKIYDPEKKKQDIFAYADAVRNYAQQVKEDSEQRDKGLKDYVDRISAGGESIKCGPAETVTFTAGANRLESVAVSGFTTQTGTGDPSPTNIRLIENAGADGTTFVDVNGQQTQIPLQAPLHEGDTLETNVVYNGAFKCVETHVKATVSVDGQTTLFTQDTNGYAVALPGAADGAVICNAFSGLSASSQSVTIPASAFPSTVTNLETANTWAQSQNVVIEYPLSIPKVYADTSVPIDNPQGASTVSSEESTTLTVAISAPVGRVNGKTGSEITLTKADIGLSNVDNTPDAQKNVKGLAVEQTDVITGLPTGLYYYKANTPGAPDTQDGLLLALVYTSFGAHLAFPTDGGIYFRWAVDNFSEWVRLDQ